MEQYLLDDYDVFADDNLTNEDQIIDFIHDCGYEWFDCGQGYFEDEITKIINIGDKFYSVLIKAEVWNTRQDRGDDVYYVEEITEVTYKEIPKPQRKPTKTVEFTMSATSSKLNKVRKLLNDLNIDYTEN